MVLGYSDRKLSEHFALSEFRCHGPECSLIEPIVAPELIENLECWRAILNLNLAPGEKEHRLIINSGCRCPVHNSREGGKPGSAHLYDPHTGKACRAADCWCPTRPVGEIYQAALQVEAFKGIGLAPPVAADPAKGIAGRRGYVHVDVRPTATRAQWGYNERGVVVALASVLPGIGIDPARRVVV